MSLCFCPCSRERKCLCVSVYLCFCPCSREQQGVCDDLRWSCSVRVRLGIWFSGRSPSYLAPSSGESPSVFHRRSTVESTISLLPQVWLGCTIPAQLRRARPCRAAVRREAARWALLSCGFLAWAFSGTQNEATGLYFPQLIEEFGGSMGSPTRITLVAAGFTMGTTAGTAMAGPLGDTRGRRFTGLLAVVIASLSSLLAMWNRGFLWLLLARGALGVAAGLLCVAVPTLMAESLPAKGLQGALASYPCGWPLGAVAAFMLAARPWRMALALGPLFVALSLGVLLWRLPESPKYLEMKGRDAEAAKARAFFGQDAEASAATAAREQAYHEGDDEESLKAVPYWRLASAFFLRGGASMSVKVWLPVWLATASGHGNPGTFMTMYGLEAVGIMVTAALISRRSSHGEEEGVSTLAAVARGSFAVSAAATAGCFLMGRSSPLLAAFLGALHLIAQANVYNMLAALTACLVPTRWRARLLSRIVLMDFLGGTLLPMALAACVRPHGLTFTGVGPVLAAAAVVYALGVILVPVPARREVPQRTPP